jgi:hypothetical protein
MNYNQLIKNWHAKATDEDYFSKYVFEYLAFIGFLKRVKFTNENGDSNAVRKLKDDTNSKTAYLAKIDQMPELKEAWQKIIDELNARPLGEVDENNGDVHTIWYWDCSCEGIENPREHVCEEQGKVRGFGDWKNMIEYWHSIRNNLFHGSKDPHDERDKILVENGYKTLSPMVEILLAER